MKTTEQRREQRRFGSTKPSRFKRVSSELNAMPWASLLSLTLAVGGIFLLVFFVSLGFLPDLDFKDLTGIILAVALVGVCTVLVIGGGFVLPTLYLDLQDQRKRLTALLQAILGVVWAFLLVLKAIFASHYPDWAYAITAFVAIAAPYLISRCVDKHTTWANLGKTYVLVGLWFVWALAIPLLYFLAMSQQVKREDWEFALRLLSFPLLFAVLSLVAASLPEHQRGLGRLGAVFLAVVIFSYLSNRPAIIPEAVIRLLGLSLDRDHVTVILTETACNSINLSFRAYGKPCEFDLPSKLGVVTDSQIKSRIGAQIVAHWRPLKLPVTARTDAQLYAALKDGENAIWQRIVLNKSEVISWSYTH